MIDPLASRILSAALGLLLIGLVPACGQKREAPAAAVSSEQKRKLIESLFESEDEVALAANIAAAEKGGLTKQAILEARFLFLIDRQDYAAVAALAPSLEEQRKSFRMEDSEIFNVPEEFFAIVEYSHALGALEKKDTAGFKEHIKEAFWLSPRQAQAFGPHIERLRLDQAMATLKIDLQQKFRQQADLKMVTLASLMGESKHVLLHFWSPWSTECEANLPDFLAMAQELANNHLPVVSVLLESDPETLTAANKFRADLEAKNVGEWIVDNSKPSLNRTLRVLDLPSVALLSAEGAVLYNGSPSDAALWTALRKIAPKVQRPRLEPAE